MDMSVGNAAFADTARKYAEARGPLDEFDRRRIDILREEGALAFSHQRRLVWALLKEMYSNREFWFQYNAFTDEGLFEFDGRTLAVSRPYRLNLTDLEKVLREGFAEGDKDA